MTNHDQTNPDRDIHLFNQLARLVLAAFLLTFIITRIIVFLIMSRTIPDVFLYLGGTHVHHLNYGIFLLAFTAGYLLLAGPRGRALSRAAVCYGIGMALTFDEFGMWLHLGGGYWQRASWDAVIVLTAAFTLLAFAPALKKFRPHHWLTAVLLILLMVLFFFLLAASFEYADRKFTPGFRHMETAAPQ